MKKFYEINVAHGGKVDTHIFYTKKGKNDWLVKYLTHGNGSHWGEKQYQAYVKQQQAENKKCKTFEKYIFSLIRDADRLTIRNRHEIILIREKKV